MQYTSENLEGLRQPTLRSLYKEMRDEYICSKEIATKKERIRK